MSLSAGLLDDDDGEAPKPTRACLDCGLPVSGAFCHHCGQRQTLRPLALMGLIWDLLIEILDTDARVWRTLRTLITRPGELTLDWAAGRRTRHVPPFRLYLVLNVVTFLVFSLSATPDFITSDEGGALGQGEAELTQQLEALEGSTGEDAEKRRQRLEQGLTALRQVKARRDAALTAAGNEDSATTPESGGSAQEGAPDASEQAEQVDFTGDFTADLSDEDRIAIAWLEQRGFTEEALLATVQEIAADPPAFAARVYEQLPSVMMALLPLLALAMSLLYITSGKPYVVHLVGLAHLHAFGFLLLLLMDGFVGFGALLDLLAVPALPMLFAFLGGAGGGIALMVYLVAWLKRLYGHGTGVAMGMSLVVLWLHAMGVLLGVVTVMVVTFLREVGG